MKKTEPVTVEESNSPTSDTIESHPSFGAIQISRVSSQPGAALFQSDVRNPHYISLRIHEADRRRGLNRDWVHPGKLLVEVDMTLTQWGEFVSSFNQGSGVPCTLAYRQTGEMVEVPRAPFLSRFDVTLNEVEDKTNELVEDITERFEKFMELRLAKAPKKEQDEALRYLQSTIENAPGNAKFAAQSMVEHVEGVVAQARTEINNHLYETARSLGIDPSVDFRALEAGESE